MDMISPPHQRNLSRSTRYPVRPPVCRHPPPRLALTAYETDIFFLTISALSTRALRSRVRWTPSEMQTLDDIFLFF